MNQPFFSIIIPTYNRAVELKAAIQSVLDQVFTSFELLVVDDGGSDDTAAVAASFKDDRIHYFYQSNKGVSSARNYGAGMANADWILFLDSDDTVENSWLADFKNVIESSSQQLVIAFCEMKILRKDSGTDEITSPRKPYPNGNEVGIYIPGTFMVRKSLFEQVGGYDENLHYSENTELSFRIMALHPQVGFMDKPNLHYNPSADGGSKNLINKYRANLYIIEKHRALFDKNRRAKQLYLQVSAVAAFKSGLFKEGRQLMAQALIARPFTLKTWFRWMAAQSVIVAKKVWKSIC